MGKGGIPVRQWSRLGLVEADDANERNAIPIDDYVWLLFVCHDSDSSKPIVVPCWRLSCYAGLRLNQCFWMVYLHVI